MKKYTIRPINTGFIKTNKKSYVYHHSTHKYYDVDGFVKMPVAVFLIEDGEKKILVDTGMCNTEIADKYHHPGSYQPEGYSIIDQLKKINIKPEEIDMIIFTHLHWDHVQHVKAFKNAELLVQKKEYEYALNPIPLYYKSYEFPTTGLRQQFEGLNFRLVDGDEEIFDGISVCLSAGHSIAHQSVVVNTRNGQYHCVGDLIFSLDNLKSIEEIHYNITPPARFLNIDDAWRSIEALKSRAQDFEHILPAHTVEMIPLIERGVVLGG